MEARCPHCDSTMLVTEEARRTRVLDCPTCGNCFSANLVDGLKIQCPDPDRLEVGASLEEIGVSLEATDQRWCLAASTRSVELALCSLMGSTIGLALMGLLIWIALHQPKDAALIFWFAPLILAMLMVTACLAAMYLCGRVEITVTGSQGTVFTGVGTLGKTQEFDWTKTTGIEEVRVQGRGRGEVYYEIVLHGTKKIRTGKYLTGEQSRVILQALHELQPRQQPGEHGDGD